MAIRLQTSEAPDLKEVETKVKEAQENAREAQRERQLMEIKKREAEEAAQLKEAEQQNANSIEKEIGERTSA